MGYILQKLSKHPEINLVVVADHGQINIVPDKFYYISDYIDNDMLALKPYCSSICTIQPAKEYTSQQIIQKMKPLFDTDGFRYFM